MIPFNRLFETDDIYQTMADNWASDFFRRLNVVEDGYYQPTLVVGLGGAGCRILRHLKRHLVLSPYQKIKLLGIDSDLIENAEQIIKGGPSLESHELALLTPHTAIESLDRARRGDPNYSHILDFLPDSYGKFKNIHDYTINRIASGRGAGQFRRAGKLLFVSNVIGGANIARKLEHLRGELINGHLHQGIHDRNITIDHGVNIYVVCSIAGGTGAGCLIDALALLRKTFSGESDRIVTFALLPGANLDMHLVRNDQWANTRANAIGTLSELQAIKFGSVFPVTFSWVGYHSPVTIPMRDIRRFPDSMYLIGDPRRRMHPFDVSQMDLCQAVGTFLYSVMPTGIGIHSQRASIINNGVTNVEEEMARWQNSQVPRLFSGLGFASIEFPAREIYQFACMDGLFKWLSYWMESVDGDGMQTVAEGIISKMSIGDSETFSTHVGVSENVVGELKDFSREECERLVKVTCSKKSFFEYTQRHMERFEEERQNIVMRVDRYAAPENEEVLKIFELAFSEVYTKNLESARACLGNLRERIQQLRAALRAEPARIKSELGKVQASKAELANVIMRKFPLFSTSAQRILYLNELVREKRLKVLQDTYPLRLAAVLKIENRITECLQKLNELNYNLRPLRERLCKCLEAAKRGRASSLVCSLITTPEYGKWCERNSVCVVDNVALDTTDISAECVCTAVHTEVHKQVSKALEEVDLVSLLTRSDEVDDTLENDGALGMRRDAKRMIADAGSQILFSYRSAHKYDTINYMPSEILITGHFVAGEAAGEAFATRYFGRAMYRSREERHLVIQTDNPYLISSSQLMTEIGAAHWAGFQEAEAAYRRSPESEWRAGIFPASVKIPPLFNSPQEEDESK